MVRQLGRGHDRRESSAFAKNEWVDMQTYWTGAQQDMSFGPGSSVPVGSRGGSDGQDDAQVHLAQAASCANDRGELRAMSQGHPPDEQDIFAEDSVEVESDQHEVQPPPACNEARHIRDRQLKQLRDFAVERMEGLRKPPSKKGGCFWQTSELDKLNHVPMVIF